MTYIYERKQTSDLFHDLKRMGRDNLSYEGAEALMEYLEQIAEDTGEPIEYDPIAYCCEYIEFDGLDEFSERYPDTPHDSWDDVSEQTTVIQFGNGSAIVQAF